MNYGGDSLTAALSAQDQPGRIYYPWWVTMLRGDPLPTVYALAGNGIADQASPIYSATPDDSFLLIGTNDRLNYRIGGVPNSDPNGVALFKNAVMAMTYWMAGTMLTSRSAGWTFPAGVWTDYVPSHPWAAIGKYSNVSGSISSVNFIGDVLLAGYTMVDGGATGSATVKVDGVTVGTINCTPPRPIALSPGHSMYAPGVFRASGFGPGAHTATFTTTSANFFLIDWVATTRAPAHFVRLLTLPYTANGDNLEVDTYNSKLYEVEAQCATDGFDVEVIDTGSVVRLFEMCSNTTTPFVNTNVHPNNHGHMNMAKKIIDSL